MMLPQKLVEEIARDVFTMARVPKRLRLAVTPEEYVAIRDHMLKTYGVFYGRIRDIPLVVDEKAADPDLSFELKQPDVA